MLDIEDDVYRYINDKEEVPCEAWYAEEPTKEHDAIPEEPSQPVHDDEDDLYMKVIEDIENRSTTQNKEEAEE